jgi:hypothetical protein
MSRRDVDRAVIVECANNENACGTGISVDIDGR